MLEDKRMRIRFQFPGAKFMQFCEPAAGAITNYMIEQGLVRKIAHLGELGDMRTGPQGVGKEFSLALGSDPSEGIALTLSEMGELTEQLNSLDALKGRLVANFSGSTVIPNRPVKEHIVVISPIWERLQSQKAKRPQTPWWVRIFAPGKEIA